MAELRLGTSSWSEKSWVGPFYPPGTAPGDFLEYYATRFDTVEVDSTYYRVPSPSLTARWQRILPDGFELAAKFPRSIVHGGQGASPNPEQLLRPGIATSDRDRFLEAMSHLGSKCGPLIFQFPYFNRSVFTAAGPFLDRLDRFLRPLPPEFRYGVEIRNGRWINHKLLDLLREHRIALVLLDLVYMPDPWELSQNLDLITTDFVYARLVGDRKRLDTLTDRFDRVVIDQSERIHRWAQLIADLAPKVPKIYTYANNHFAGHGPTTVRELMAAVETVSPSS